MSKQSESLKIFYKTPKGIELKARLSECAKINKPHLGHKHSPESIKKMRNAKLGKKASSETRDKMSESHKGEKHHMYGKHMPQETKTKLSKSLKELYQTPNGKEIRAKIDEINKGNHHHLGHKNSPDVIAKMSEIKTGKIFSQETRNRMSETGKELWKQEFHRNKLVKASRLALNISPNKPETYLLDLLDKQYPNEWKYVGDGQVIICGRNPDVININGRKSVILLHGDYWHLWRHQKNNPELTKEQVEKDDVAFYRVYGWDCLIIWENELKDIPQVTEKIAEFCNSVHVR